MPVTAHTRWDRLPYPTAGRPGNGPNPGRGPPPFRVDVGVPGWLGFSEASWSVRPAGSGHRRRSPSPILSALRPSTHREGRDHLNPVFGLWSWYGLVPAGPRALSVCRYRHAGGRLGRFGYRPRGDHRRAYRARRPVARGGEWAGRGPHVGKNHIEEAAGEPASRLTGIMVDYFHDPPTRRPVHRPGRGRPVGHSAEPPSSPEAVPGPHGNLPNVERGRIPARRFCALQVGQGTGSEPARECFNPPLRGSADGDGTRPLALAVQSPRVLGGDSTVGSWYSWQSVGKGAWRRSSASGTNSPQASPTSTTAPRQPRKPATAPTQGRVSRGS